MLSPARMLLVSFLCSGRLRQPVIRVFFRKRPGRGGAGGYTSGHLPSAGCASFSRSLAPQFGLCAPSARRERTSTPMPMAREWQWVRRADLSACVWVCYLASASCDHVYISRQASAAHRTHNNKNTTKHRSFQTATICSSWTCSSKTQIQLHARALARTHGAEQRLRASRALALKSRARATLL